MHAMLPESAEPLHEIAARGIELLKDGLQSFRRDRFDSDQGSLNPGLAHGVQEFGIFSRFHRDLREEHHVLWQLGQASEQFKSLVLYGLHLSKSVVGILTPCQLQILKRDRIEVVIGQRDESKSHSTQFDNFVDDPIARPLARPLAVCAPHGTKGAVLGTSTHGLNRSPHVAVARHQLPTCREELVGFDAPSFVDLLQESIRAIAQNPCPNDVSIPLYHRMSASELKRFLRVEAGVNAAEDYMRSALSGHAPYFVATQAIAAMDPDANHGARLKLRAVDLRQSFVAKYGVAIGTRSSSGNHVKPSGRYNSNTKRQVARIDEMHAH